MKQDTTTTTVELPHNLGVTELAALIGDGARCRILDVRTPGEFRAAHIEGAFNIPLDQLRAYAREICDGVTDPVILVCQSGSRAAMARSTLAESGMSCLHTLDGGMNAWLAAGQGVRRGAKRVSLERQVRIAAGMLAAIGGVLALVVDPLFALIPTVIGSGLVFAGVTDTCGMGLLLARLPYNRGDTDVRASVRAFITCQTPSRA